MYLAQASAFFVPLLLAPLPASGMLHCDNIRIKGHSFDLNELGGPHSVVTTKFDADIQAQVNTTYTVDICKPLKKSGEVKDGEQCKGGTRGMHRLPPVSLRDGTR